MIIISPSGDLYGSEQVLLEYLFSSTKKYFLFVPSNSLLEKKLEKENLKVKSFENLICLYFKAFVFLLLNKQDLYINEAGHIRYIKLLARLLPFKHFFVHIRLLEDCSPNRLKNLSKNIHLVTVSEYLKSKIPRQYPIRVIYDPYTLQNKSKINSSQHEVFSIGIVGRVTCTKGIDLLLPILSRLSSKIKQPINLYFFGSYDTKDKWYSDFKKRLESLLNVNVQFKGFISSKQEIYSCIDLLLHLNKAEALGRILFEAVDYNTPFLAFNQGGCGELANQLKLDDFLITNNEEWAIEFVHKITTIKNNRNAFEKQLENAKRIIKDRFNSQKYSQTLEAFFNSPSFT